MSDPKTYSAEEVRGLLEAVKAWRIDEQGCPPHCSDVYGDFGEDITKACAWMGDADAALAASAPTLARQLLDAMSTIVRLRALNAAADNGVGARCDGDPEDANPHPEGDVLRAAWADGWNYQDAVERLEVALARIAELEGAVGRLMIVVGGCVTEPACGDCEWCDARALLAGKTGVGGE